MKIILILLLNILLFQNLYAQSEEQMRNIDKARQETDNNLENYEKAEKLNDSTGSKYVYTLDREIKLIIIEYTEQKINKRVKWYFENGQLIFSEQVWKNTITNKLIDEEKFYILNKHLIGWYKFESKVDPASIEFKNADDQLSSYAKQLTDDIIKK